MNLQDFLKTQKTELKTQIVAAVDTFLASRFAKTPYYADVVEKLKTFSVRGKMIRGLLIPYTYQQLTGATTVPGSVWKAAAAMELMHTGLLIHDDIIDNDFERRGEKSMFAEYADGTSETFGKNMAICVGDIAFFMGFHILGDVQVKGGTTALQVMSQELLLVGIGEMQDVAMAENGQEPTAEDIETMYLLKTARYTFSLPFLLAGTLAGITASDLSTLEEAGEKVGILFQIQDDELGITGNSDETGKPVGSDIREGKKTLSRKLLYDTASKDELEYLTRVFGNKEASADDIQNVIRMYQTKKIPEQIQERIDRLSQEITLLETCLQSAYPECTICSDIMSVLQNRTH